jgi:RNase P subunit RPR2
MTAPFHEGDITSGICSSCRKPVQTRFETRSIRPTRSRVTFSNVLVGVCTECNSTIAVPRQSMAQLLELGAGK